MERIARAIENAGGAVEQAARESRHVLHEGERALDKGPFGFVIGMFKELLPHPKRRKRDRHIKGE